jgi:hypothetical protein
LVLLAARSFVHLPGAFRPSLHWLDDSRI